ncbi:MAG TPA: murein biosynthesis integral membrane protein MurJ [Verrucomicrobiae bacterium]|jgi:putative peptidoglycan lipid II flippase|nr:murein biosynthesis integral membrane protein MurJ [Verrucomicrobiae bacterium]
MLKSSGAMALATLISRLLGMVREMVYYSFMGVGWVNDAFQLAFTIPNLFRRLLGEGALTAAFIPIFKEKEKIHGEAEMWRASNAVISGLVVAASVVIAVVLVIVSVALSVHQFDGKTELMLQLLRVMFPYMLLVCLTACFMGMLNARGHFFIPAMGATMLNVVMIASVLWLAPQFATNLPKDERLPHQIFALAIGVLAAGVAQASFQLPTLYQDGFRLRWVSPWRDETVRRVIYRMVPGAIGVAAFQINVAVVQLLGFKFGNGIVSSFNGGVRLMELPQGMFGISLATYLLPTLSALATDKNYKEFRSTLRNGLSTLIFLNLIAAILLAVLAHPIVQLLFERGEFKSDATDRVSLALMCLAPGLVAFSTVNILARAFYALGDTQTPMKISIACLMLNLVFAVALIVPYKQGGLGIANSVTSVCNVSLLTFALRKKLGRLEMSGLRATFVPLAIAGVVAGFTAWGCWYLWERELGHHNLALKIGAVFGPAAVAGIVYWVIGTLGKVPAAREILGFVFGRFSARKSSAA